MKFIKLHVHTLLLLTVLTGVALSQDGIKVVKVIGRASIKNNDVQMARDEALIDAQIKAASVFGVSVDGQTVLQWGRMVDNTIINRVKGFVRAFNILRESQENNTYSVEIEAWVSGQISDEEVKKYSRNFSLVLGISTYDGQIQIADERPESILTEVLVDAGFQVIDKRQLLAIKGDATFAKMLEGDSEAAVKIGQRFLTNVVIVGKVEAKFSQAIDLNSYDGKKAQLISYIGNGRIRAYETDSGLIIAQINAPMEGIKGFGQNRDQARESALIATVQFLKSEFARKMSEYTRSKERTISILVKGIPSLDRFKLVKDYLTGQRWVNNVQDKGFQVGGISEFTLQYAEKIYILAHSLDNLTFLKVTAKDWNRIEADFTM